MRLCSRPSARSVFGAYWNYPAVNTQAGATHRSPLAHWRRARGVRVLQVFQRLEKGRPGERSKFRWPDRFEGNDCIRTANGQPSATIRGSSGHKIRMPIFARSIPSVPDRVCYEPVRTPTGRPLAAVCVEFRLLPAPIGPHRFPIPHPVRTLGERHLASS